MSHMEESANSSSALVADLLRGLLILGQDEAMSKKVGITIATLKKAAKVIDKENAQHGAPTRRGEELAEAHKFVQKGENMERYDIVWAEMDEVRDQILRGEIEAEKGFKRIFSITGFEFAHYYAEAVAAVVRKTGNIEAGRAALEQLREEDGDFSQGFDEIAASLIEAGDLGVFDQLRRLPFHYSLNHVMIVFHGPRVIKGRDLAEEARLAFLKSGHCDGLATLLRWLEPEEAMSGVILPVIEAGDWLALSNCRARASEIGRRKKGFKEIEKFCRRKLAEVETE